MKNLNLLLLLALLYVGASCTTTHLTVKVDRYVYKTTEEASNTTLQDFRLRLDRFNTNYIIYPDSSIHLSKQGSLYLKKEGKRLTSIKSNLEKIEERKVVYTYNLLIIPGEVTKYYILDYKVTHKYKNYQKEIDSLCLEKFKSIVSNLHRSVIKQKEYID